MVNKQCPVANFIRWRYSENAETSYNDAEKEKLTKQVGLDQTENKKLESNTKVIEWSDGSVSLVIGEQTFEIQAEKVHRAQCFA